MTSKKEPDELENAIGADGEIDLAKLKVVRMAPDLTYRKLADKIIKDGLTIETLREANKNLRMENQGLRTKIHSIREKIEAHAAICPATKKA